MQLAYILRHIYIYLVLHSAASILCFHRCVSLCCTAMAEGQGRGAAVRSIYFLTHFKLVKEGEGEGKGQLQQLGTACKSGSSVQVAGLSGKQGEGEGRGQRGVRTAVRLRHSRSACVQQAARQAEEVSSASCHFCAAAKFLLPRFWLFGCPSSLFIPPFFGGGQAPQAATSMNLCS